MSVLKNTVRRLRLAEKQGIEIQGAERSVSGGRKCHKVRR
uniref:Uncharacterized protein n=1 Tax=uncultured Desulfobacterium sp. TaxID=201089 RepID=E1YI28_9BACT|nr:unknown protein [uncultured Desulfobacterium sp.]